MTEPRVSIVIPAYNARDTLGRCVTACQNQSVPVHEIIVVDDGSTDGTLDVARSLPGVCVVSQPNAGPATARNTGAAASTGDLIAFTDADCVPEPNWIAALVTALPADAAAIGGTYACANPSSWLARCIQAEIAQRHADFQSHAALPGLVVDVDFLGSFNVAFRRSAFEAVGGFDTRFRAASAEDNDICYRLTGQGARLCYTPQAVVAHYHPSRVLPYLRTQARHGYWRVFLYTIHPRRSSGDGYAALGELLRPPAVVGWILLSLLLAIGAPAIAALFFAVGLLLYGVALLPRVRFTAAPIPRWQSALFLGVLLCRDLARGWGLCHGVVDFIVRPRLARR